MGNDNGRPHDRATVIAEIGENHAGDMDLARRMVVEASAAGADIVTLPSYRGADVARDDAEREWFERVTLPDSAHRELAGLAASKGTTLMSSPFTIERAHFLVEELGMRAIKVPSSEMLNFGLLDYLAETAQTVYLSTGLADLDEVAIAVSRLENIEDLVIMHCVSQYPLMAAEANLRAIGTLATAFPEHRVGYSDHTIGVLAPLLAVALGAAAIEKHFTLDRSLPGSDHVLSVTPPELSELVHGIREAEVLLGTGEKRRVVGRGEIRQLAPARIPQG
jgi:sialic acid synthase SpsE